MSNNPHNTTMLRQVITVLVLLNAVALRDDYLQADGLDTASIAFFFLTALAVGMAVRSRQAG